MVHTNFWISLSCIICVISQSLQGVFLNMSTDNSEKAVQMEDILKFSHYL